MLSFLAPCVKKLQEQEAKMDSITTQLNRVECTLAWSTTHISDLTTQFSCMIISNTQTAPSNMLQCQSPQQPNYSHQTGHHLSSIATEEEKAVVQVNMMKYPQFPNTAEGRTSYFEQLCTWKAAHGENAPITIDTPFPLRPGTTQVCSGECYKCGMQGHRGADCEEGMAKVPPQESKWRVLCGRYLG